MYFFPESWLLNIYQHTITSGWINSYMYHPIYSYLTISISRIILKSNNKEERINITCMTSALQVQQEKLLAFISKRIPSLRNEWISPRSNEDFPNCLLTTLTCSNLPAEQRHAGSWETGPQKLSLQLRNISLSYEIHNCNYDLTTQLVENN